MGPYLPDRPHVKVNTKCFSRTWESGFCQTYNPPELLPPSFENRIGLFLGHLSFNSHENYNFVSFKIYVHEKGQFWPKPYFETVKYIRVLSNQYKVFKFYIDHENKVWYPFFSAKMQNTSICVSS